MYKGMNWMYVKLGRGGLEFSFVEDKHKRYKLNVLFSFLRRGGGAWGTWKQIFRSIMASYHMSDTCLRIGWDAIEIDLNEIIIFWFFSKNTAIRESFM